MRKFVLLISLLMSSVAVADETEWYLGSATLRALPVGEARPLRAPDGTHLHEFAANDEVRGSVISRSGTHLLLLVKVVRRRKPGAAISASWKYGYLLRISKTPEGKFTAKKLMDSASTYMSVLHRNVLEVGEVADDGKTAHLKFGEANQQSAPYRMHYTWQNWDLEMPRVVTEAPVRGATK